MFLIPLLVTGRSWFEIAQNSFDSNVIALSQILGAKDVTLNDLFCLAAQENKTGRDEGKCDAIVTDIDASVDVHDLGHVLQMLSAKWTDADTNTLASRVASSDRQVSRRSLQGVLLTEAKEFALEMMSGADGTPFPYKSLTVNFVDVLLPVSNVAGTLMSTCAMPSRSNS